MSRWNLQKITRRRALQGLAASAIGATLAGGSPRRVSAQAERAVDVVVVGAGAAGLMTARNLVQAGRSVVLIEANDRVGGRLKRGEIAGQVIDLGGQWVGPTQTRALEVAAEFGMKTYATPEHGDAISEIGGEIFRGKGVAIPPATMTEFVSVLGTLNKLMAQIPLDAPWTAPNAREHDAITVDTWMRQNIKHAQLHELFRIVVEAVFSCDPSQISFLEFLFYNASGGTLQEMIGTQGGAQQDLFHGGYHQICARMAADLGDRVVLSSPVRAIEQSESGVTVRADKGTWTAQRIVVAAPPATAGRIDYSPTLPHQRDGLQQRMPMGSVIKCFLAYDTPFWREDGASGSVASASSEFGIFYDITEPGKQPGVLSGFFDGAPAQRWADRTKADRRAQVIKDVVRTLGVKAENPIAYEENVWPLEPWSKGGYACVPGPGVITHFGEALRKPVGRIHWAGTETSEKWCGYVDGALRSGDRVAKEVIEAIA